MLRYLPRHNTALDVSQPERSSEERDEQPKNVWDRSVTLDVSQQETSKAKSEEQLQNISCRFLSLGTVQPVKIGRAHV